MHSALGQSPANKGRRYPADPPRVEEIVAVMRRAGDGPYGLRLRGLIVVLWRSGLRITEALDLNESDLDLSQGAFSFAAGREAAAGTSAWTTGAGISFDPGSSTAAGFLWDRSSASFALTVAVLRGRLRPCAGASKSLPARLEFGVGSRLTSSVMLTLSRWHAKAFPST